jgi:hypothetical protein
MDDTSDDNSNGSNGLNGSNGSSNELFNIELPPLNGPGSGRTNVDDADNGDVVDGSVNGSGVGDFLNRAKNAAENISNAAVNTFESRVTAELEKLEKPKNPEKPEKPTEGGAEYTLLDTIMLVFIILAILMLLYVVLAESGVLSVAESGANYLITTHTD